MGLHTADVAGFGLLIGSLGDCNSLGCSDKQSERLRASIAILAISRIAQLGDTFIRAMNYDRSIQAPGKSSASIGLLPSSTGAELQFAMTF